MPKVEQSEEASTSTPAVKEKVKSDENKLFSGLTAHFTDAAAEPELIHEFVRLGGTLTRNTQKAKLAFHYEITMNIKQQRQSYRSSCRHLHIKWLRTSLEANALQPYPVYAVLLKS